MNVISFFFGAIAVLCIVAAFGERKDTVRCLGFAMAFLIFLLIAVLV